MKSSVLVKIDSIISTKNTENIALAFSIIKSIYIQIKRENEEKKRKALNLLYAVISKKNKVIQEKCLRTVGNWVNSKKILEINMKMLARVVAKVFQTNKRSQFRQLRESIGVIDKLRKVAEIFQHIKVRDGFSRLKDVVQIKNNKLHATLTLASIYASLKIKESFRKYFQIL